MAGGGQNPKPTGLPQAPFFDKAGNMSKAWVWFFQQVLDAAEAAVNLAALEAIDSGPDLEALATIDAVRVALEGSDAGASILPRLIDLERLVATIDDSAATTIATAIAVLEANLERLVATLDDSGLALAPRLSDLERLVATINDNPPPPPVATGVTSLNGIAGAVVLQDGIGIQVDPASPDINLSFAPAFRQIINASTVTTDADIGIAVFLNAGAQSITLQHGGSVVPHRVLYLKNYINSTNQLTIIAHAGDTIDLQTNYILDPGQGLFLQWDGGTQWIVIAACQDNDEQLAIVLLTAAQIKGMFTTPVQLLGAAGANTVLEIISVILDMAYAGPTYAGGGDIQLYYSVSGALAATAIVNTFLVGPTSNQMVKVYGVLGPGNSTDMINQNIFIKNIGGAFTGGNGLVTLLIHYRTVRAVV